MSISTQNTVFKGYISYNLFTVIGELSDIVAFYKTSRVSFLPSCARAFRL